MSLKQEMKLNQGLNQYSFGFCKIKIQNGSIIYYNQQRCINYTDEALSLFGEQLDATSRMSWQNRIALDYLLAEKGGVCVIFGDQCCTFIPNNTAPEGAFTEVMTK